MRTRVIVSAVFSLALATPVIAQQAISREVSDTTRRQVESFERSLRGAIDSAAAHLSKRVREALPDSPIGMRFQADPVVMGVLMPDESAYFTVLIPAIDAVDLKLAALGNRPPARSNVGIAGTAPPLFDPTVEYTTFTHAALIDTLLDNSLALPIPADKTLTVFAGELLPQQAGPFVTRSRTLILQIKGEDLIALRQNRLSREDAKARIMESRY